MLRFFKYSILLFVTALIQYLSTHDSLALIDRNYSFDNKSDKSAIILDSSKHILHNIAGDDLFAYFGFTPKVTIKNSAKPYAHVNSENFIELSTALIQIIKTEEELAFLLAHELSHVLLDHKHSHQIGQNAYTEQEISADALAVSLLKNSGYSTKLVHKFLERLRTHPIAGTNMKLGELFPTLSKREALLQNKA